MKSNKFLPSRGLAPLRLRRKEADARRDETGGRRFWPVTCDRIDIDGLARDRNQLWAEAKARFDVGSVWWLETAGLVQMASHQMERYEGDPWEEVIGPGMEERSSVSTL